MSLQIESCKPFYLLTDSPSLTLDEIKVKFPTATKSLHVATNNSGTHGTEYYLIWAGYEVDISATPVFGTRTLNAITDPYDNGLRGMVAPITIPTDRIRCICDYTPPASNSKSEGNEVFEDEPRNKE